MKVGVMLTEVVITNNTFVPQDPPLKKNNTDLKLIKKLRDLQVEKEKYNKPYSNIIYSKP